MTVVDRDDRDCFLRQRILRATVFLTALMAAGRSVCAQFDEAADLLPGLLGVYSVDDAVVERLDPMVSFDWGGAMPDERLPTGQFEVSWTSQLLMREEALVTFHAFVDGSVSMDIDGQTVLKAETSTPAWVSGEPVELTFGFLELDVRFARTTDHARVHLFWSSDRFPLEPLPQHQLFRDEPRPDLAAVHTGRMLFDAYRCNRCHQRAAEQISLPAPGLLHVTDGLNRDWLVRKLGGHSATQGHARMPDFGFAPDDVEAIAAWLEHFSQPADLIEVPNFKAAAETPEGDLLLKSVGCLACHVVDGDGVSGPFGGGELTHVGGKRSLQWLYTWLSRPERINAQHQMPLIRLTPRERASLAETLSQLGREPGIRFHEASLSDKRDTELVRRGRALAQASRCAACHNIPAMEADLTGVPSLEQPVTDWESSCLGDRADVQRHRPVYRQADREALKAYIESRFDRQLSLPSEFERGQSVVVRRNCLACHERNHAKGIVATAGRVSTSDARLRGQSQSLIPPALTAVGDKLHDEPLREAVRGAQRAVRLPWLKVRMPQFRHAPDDEQALLSYLIGQDRIPTKVRVDRSMFPREEGESSRLLAQAVPDEETLILGHALAGAGGFNCVACHKFGTYEPRNVALGTRGSDLLGVGGRMRAEYFHRWTRAPLRVMPGIEMPNFNKAVPGILGEDVDRQLQALWGAIHDPRFKAPTNPTQVEQFLVVGTDNPPRIVRDVFTASEENGGGYIARPMAIGFGNGHSVLFDLDRFCVRGWTLGDFARQRTEGKSWYWDLAGVDLMTGFGGRPDVVLQHLATGEVLEPIAEQARHAQLLGYTTEGQTVTSRHRMRFEAQGEKSLVIRQEWKAVEEQALHDDSAGMTGILRRLSVDAVPEGYRLMWRRGQETVHAAQGAIGPRMPDGVNAAEADGTEIRPGAREGLVIQYRCRQARPDSAVLSRPDLPPGESLVTTLPGFSGERLKLPASIMPTSLGWTAEGALVFTSLKGHVYLVGEGAADGQPESLIAFEEGLPAPFGVLADGEDLLVVTKAELLRLRDSNADGRCDTRTVVTDGWGYSDNYHDWTTGPVRDAAGNLYLALGSDYQQEGRPAETTRWRGKVIRVTTDGRVEPFAHELRFPQGIAFDGRGRLFVTDQQGVANTFNELNHIREGERYGVQSLYDPQQDRPESRPAIQIPHPWTRSVNGVFFLPEQLSGPLAPFAGHGIGCEYNGKFLIRFSLQEVGGELQGATYEFSRPAWSSEEETFLGPICGAVSEAGELYIGSIFDSGWLGGPNVGEIVRLRPDGHELPNGIRELRATADGLELEFLRPVTREAAVDPEAYLVAGYTRVWEGAYATPDSGRYTPEIRQVELSADARTVRLRLDDVRPRYVYEVRVDMRDGDGIELFPHTGHYTMNQIPERP